MPLMTINEFLLFHSDRKKQLHNKTAAATSKLQTPFNSHRTSGHCDPDKIPRDSQERRACIEIL